MSTPKGTLPLFAIFFGVCCAVAGVLIALVFWKDSLDESPTFTYPDLTYAVERRAVQLGWMPDFLPASATNIRENRNADNGTTIIALEFNPTDFASLSNRLIPVPPSQFSEIRPARIHKEQPWFPTVILRGELDKLAAEGFGIYQSEVDYTGKRRLVKKRWYFAINPHKGLCYLWRGYVRD